MNLIALLFGRRRSRGARPRRRNYNVPVRLCEQCKSPLPVTVPPYYSFCGTDCLFDWCAAGQTTEGKK